MDTPPPSYLYLELYHALLDADRCLDESADVVQLCLAERARHPGEQETLGAELAVLLEAIRMARQVLTLAQALPTLQGAIALEQALWSAAHAPPSP